jgi:cell division protein FtsQ
MWQDVKILNSITNVLLALLLLMLLMSGVWWLMQRSFFDLSVIRVEGVQQQELRHVNQLSIRDIALPQIKGNFFTSNLNIVRSAFENVPWVSNASVLRVWPNKLLVTIEEHKVLGAWGKDGNLMSSKGEVFTANIAEAEDDADLIQFSGPTGSEKEVLAQYLLFKKWFAKIGLAPEAVDYSDRYAWSVKLDNGLSVELGRDQEPELLKRRVDQLMRVYPELVARLQDSIVSVDMRYPNGLALRSKNSHFGFVAKKNNVADSINKDTEIKKNK